MERVTAEKPFRSPLHSETLPASPRSPGTCCWSVVHVKQFREGDLQSLSLCSLEFRKVTRKVHFVSAYLVRLHSTPLCVLWWFQSLSSCETTCRPPWIEPAGLALVRQGQICHHVNTLSPPGLESAARATCPWPRIKPTTRQS